MSYIGKTTDGFGVRDRFVYVVSAGATSVSGADANGATLKFTDGAYVDVYLNGVLLKPTTDYNTSTANTIAGISSMSASDEVTVVVYDVFTVADTVSATSGGTFNGGITNNSTTTLNDDVTFTGDDYNMVWDKSQNRLEFDDNAKAIFGTGADLQIHHNGTHSVVRDSGTGELQLAGSAVKIKNGARNENGLVFTENGALELYHDNSKKLETTTSGIEVYNGATGNQPNIFLKDMNSGVVSGDEGGGLYWYTNDGNAQGNNLAIIQKYENAAGGAAMHFEQGTGAGRTTRMVINTDGTVKIGVKDTTPNNAWALRCFNTHATHATIEGWNDNSSGKNLNLFRYDDASIFQVSNGGAVWAAGGYTSDKAFKNVIGNCTEGWSKLKDVKPKSYRYKNIHYEEKDGEEVEVFGDDDLDSNIHYGVIAQDLKKVLPDITYGEEGKMSVDYHGLLMVAINTIKELEARIKALEEA